MKNLRYKLERIWDIVRYDLPNFFRNLRTFRKGLWEYRWYDRHGVYVFMATALKDMADKTETRGYEVDITRLKKVAKMKRAAELLNNFIEDNFVDQAEAELGELILHPFEWKPSETHTDCFELIDNDTPEEREHNGKIFKRSREIEESQWKELMKILRGQDIDKYEPEKLDWDKWYNGSGLRNWWD
jgi:hypothetical protein